jgi:ribose transport system permease protein
MAQTATPVGPDAVGSVVPTALPAPARRRALPAAFPQFALLGALVVTIAVFGALRPESFLTIDNAKSVLNGAAPLLVVALGLTVVLVMQDFDLSVAGMIGLGGAVAVTLMAQHGVPWGLAIVAALGVGVLGGLLNAVLVAYLGGSAFVITLAMSTVFVGVEFAVTGQQTIFDGIPDGYANFAQNPWLFDLPAKVFIAAGLAVLAWLLLSQTEIGRYMHAIGSGPEAARLSGVRTREIRALGFVVAAMMAVAAGILITSSAAASTPQVGTPYLLPAFAAVFLGSAAFKVGQFNAPGTVVGVLFLGVIQNGLTMLSLSTAVINIVQGAILATAILVSRIGARS